MRECAGGPPPHLELEGVDELSVRVFRAYMATLHLHRRHMHGAFAASGAHPGQAMCLHVIAAHPGMTQRDLTTALHVSRPTVSKMLQGMEKAGLVERCADTGDQRRACVSLTPAGRRAQREQHVVAGALVNQTIGALPEDDRRELARLLEDLAARYEAALTAVPAAGAEGDPA